VTRAIKKIKDNYQSYCEGVERVIQKYEYNNLYDNKLEFLKDN